MKHFLTKKMRNRKVLIHEMLLFGGNEFCSGGGISDRYQVRCLTSWVFGSKSATAIALSRQSGDLISNCFLAESCSLSSSCRMFDLQLGQTLNKSPVP